MITDMQSTNEIILTRSDREEFAIYTKDVLRQISNICNLQEWFIDCYFLADNRQREISCAIDHSHLTMNIYLNDAIIEAWAREDFTWVNYVLCHEVAHIYTEELYRLSMQDVVYAMRDYVEQVREQNTERVCRLIEKGLSHNGTVDSTSETDKSISGSDSKSGQDKG